MQKNEFKILNYPENIRLRPSMYLGQIEDSSEMLREALDNSLDEVSKGNAKNIRIFTTKYDYIIADDSKVGFPLGIASNGKSIPDAALTNINAGTKFSKDQYQVGMNGVGNKCISALSDDFILCINITGRKMKYNMVPKGVERFKDDDKYLVLHYQKGIKKHEGFCKELPMRLRDKGLEDYSTIVYFRPDTTIIASAEARIPKTLDYFYAIQKLTNRKSDDISIKINNIDYEPSFEEYKYSYNVEWTQDPDCKNPKVRMLGYFDLSEDIFSSFSAGSVNSLVVPNGVHMKFFENAYKDAFREVFGDCHDQEFMGVNRLNIVLAIEFMFDSQNKVRLTRIPDFNIKETGKLKDVLKKIMKDNYEEFQNHYLKIQNFLQKKGSLNEKQKIHNILGNMEDNSEGAKRRAASFKPAKLKDAISSDRSKCELFIVEGNSAASGFLKNRNTKIHAVLPLRGVVKNATASNIEDILEQNQELRDLCKGIGSGVDKSFNLDRCRFGKIIICTDADPDGNRIAALLLGFFAAHMKYLLKDGRVYVLMTPYYIQNNKFIYTGINEKELNWKKPFKRVKGLGALDKYFKDAILNEQKRYLIQITDKDVEEAISIVRDSEPKKRLLLEDGVLNTEVLK